MKIYCCECKQEINARLTNGKEIYKHRKDLFDIPFWMCDSCKNFVGCHYKTNTNTKPLGIIANKQIRAMRIKIHTILDTLWKNNLSTRKEIYRELSKYLGYQYHTAAIKTEEEANKIYNYLYEKTFNNQ